MMNNKQIIIAICLAFSQMIWAQNESDNLGVQEVQITDFFIPEIPVSSKIESIPTLKDTIQTSHRINFYPLNKPYEGKLTLEPIKAAKIKGQSVPKIHRAYVYGGVGNMSMPTSRFYYNSDRDRKIIYGLELGYVESYSKIKSSFTDLQKVSAAFRETDFAIYAKTDTDFGVLSAYASRLGRQHQAYGYDPQIYNLEESLSQQYWGYSSLSLSLQSKESDKNKLRYFTKLYAYDLNEFTENSISWSLKLKQSVNHHDYSLGIGLDYDINNQSDKYQFADSLSKEMIFSISPSLSKEIYGGVLNVGFDLKSVDTRDSASVNISVFPAVHYSYLFSPNYLKASVGFRGSLKDNSYWTLSQMNPFILNALPYDGGGLTLVNSKTKYDAYVGLTTYLGYNIQLFAECSYARVMDMPFFELDNLSSNKNKFMVVYDDVNHLHSHATIQWQISEKSMIDLTVDYHKYKTDSLQSFAYKPGFKTHLKAQCNIGDKILPQIEFFSSINRSHNNNSPNALELKNIIDFNVFLEYVYNSNISAYFKGYNMIGGYQIWEHYPVLGPQVFFGLSFKL